jgi:hypothetical protein
VNSRWEAWAEDVQDGRKMDVQKLNVIGIARLLGSPSGDDGTYTVVGGFMQCNWLAITHPDTKLWRRPVGRQSLNKTHTRSGATTQSTYHADSDDCTAIDWTMYTNGESRAPSFAVRIASLGKSQHRPFMYECVVAGADASRAAKAGAQSSECVRSEPSPITSTSTTPQNVEKNS